MVHNTLYGFLFLFISMQTLSASGQSWNSEQKITEVFGTELQSATPEQITWLHQCLNRCVVLNETMPLSDSVKLLSTVPVLRKFVADTNVEPVFHEETFNPLKYMIDFFSTRNQYFIIDSSHTLQVLKKN